LARRPRGAVFVGHEIYRQAAYGSLHPLAIPRVEWGVGMAEKSIRTGLCPGGRLRMLRLLRMLEQKRLDPTRMTSHRFAFDKIDRAFEIMDKKLDNVIKPLVTF